MGKKGRRARRPREPVKEPEPAPRRSARRPDSRLIAAAGALAGLILLIVGYLWWSSGTRPFRGDTSSYNVLLITLDTTRADRLGAYGYGKIRTPALDGLAAKGVLFENAYTPAVMTLPSHCTILTSLLPPSHGVRMNGTQRLGAAAETLPEVLKAAGFRTGAVIGSFILESMFGLDQGFEFYDDYLPGAGSLGPVSAERSATQVTEAALMLLDKVKSERWFLWAHYFDPHGPYLPPSPYLERYGGIGYDGEIAYMDFEIGRLLARVAGIGALDRTIVVAVGDHGEGLLDHGEEAHGVFLYDETTRVPLIISVPGFVEGPRRVRSLVRTTDIMPTILDLLGLPNVPASEGVSLWPLMDGKAEDLGLDAFGEATAPLLMYGWSPIASLREGRWKYIEAPRPELYDLVADPREKNNLQQAEPDRGAAMRRRLESILAAAVEIGGGADEISTTPEDQAKLRSLGYIGGETAVKDLLAGGPLALLEGGARGLPDPKDRLVQLGRISDVERAFLVKDFALASERARQIVEEEPGNANMRKHLADSLASMGRFDEALSEYRTLLADDPANVDFLLGLGLVLTNLKRHEESIAAFEKALEVHPGHVYALMFLGRIYFAQGDFDRAVEVYRKVLSLRPDHRQSIMSIARIFEGRGMPREAAVYYKRAADIDPRDIEARLSLAWLQQNSEEYDAALQTLGEVAAIDPRMSDVDLFRADIYLAMGRLREAERLYRQGIAKAPQEPLGYHGLGTIAVREGKVDVARDFFEQALRLDPDFAPSRQELEKLKAPGRSGG